MNNTTNGLIIKSQRTSGRTAPINVLDEDVLWHIFLLNANMDDQRETRVYSEDIIEDKMGRPLFTTWMSSQVCGQWRNMIIGSPSLWAQLVDLDGFSLATTSFKQEVMRRTGSSVLSIYGTVFAQKEFEREFFISTLTKNWPRIRFLKVTIDRSKLIPASTWKVISEPAKSLQVLYLRSKDGMTLPAVDSEGQNNLLSDDAPFLRKVVFWRINFNFGDSLGWLSNVRHLHISYVTSMSVSQWLYTLEQIPQLERLDLIKPFRSLADTTLKLPSVNLPNLEGISIIHELAACVIFLDHIHPRAGCYLRLDTLEDMDHPLSPAIIDLTKRVLSRYSTSWFNSRCVETLFLSVTHKEFKISEHAYYIPGVEPSFSVQINCQALADLPILFLLLDAFSACKLGGVNSLHFEVDIFPEQSLTPDVLRFLLTLPSVKTMNFWKPQTMSALLAFVRQHETGREVGPSSLFPLLSTILLDRRGRYDDGKEGLQSFQEDISQFLTWRKAIQRPVQTLNLSALKHEAELKIFDGIMDLKVLYQTEEGLQQEHTCGG